MSESFGARKVLGLFLGTLGAVVVITRGEFSASVLALPMTRGDLLILASTVNWAVYTILGRKTLSQVAAFLHLEPLVTLVAAVSLLGEPVAAATVLGGVLVLAGVCTVQRA